MKRQTNVISKTRKTIYTSDQLKYYLLFGSLKMIYFALVNSILLHKFSVEVVATGLILMFWIFYNVELQKLK